MDKLLRQEALSHGDQLQIVRIERLQSLKNELDAFKENETLNGFQKWIVNDLYQFNLPTVGFPIRSLIIIALPHPAYAKVEFIRAGRAYHFWSLVAPDFAKTDQYLKEFLAATGYRSAVAPNLPLKRLAVNSGLAVYGRNNICYSDKMGSFFSLAAYYSDVPCETDAWRETCIAERCTNCRACIKNCPTGAIRADRFLINNERCLSYFNEQGGAFPEWIPRTAHHCVYDCLRCQIVCPMNQECVNNVIGPIQFSEEETKLLLAGKPFNGLPPELQMKSQRLGLHRWPAALERNLKILMELADHAR